MQAGVVEAEADGGKGQLPIAMQPPQAAATAEQAIQARGNEMTEVPTAEQAAASTCQQVVTDETQPVAADALTAKAAAKAATEHIGGIRCASSCESADGRAQREAGAAESPEDTGSGADGRT